MKRLLFCVGLSLAATGIAQAATSSHMSGAELRKAVSGKTVYLSTSGIVVPISYRSNGTMQGKLQALAAAFAGGNKPADAGRWWIFKHQLCQRWNNWLGKKSYCYKLTRQGDKVTWVRSDGRRGTARIGG